VKGKSFFFLFRTGKLPGFHGDIKCDYTPEKREKIIRRALNPEPINPPSPPREEHYFETGLPEKIKV
jgi:hypothetical protein